MLLKASEAVLLKRVDGFLGVAGSLRWPPVEGIVFITWVLLPLLLLLLLAWCCCCWLLDLFQMEGALK